MGDSETLKIIIVLCSILGFFLLLFIFLFWYFKFHNPPSSGSLRARPTGSRDPSFNARMANFNDSVNSRNRDLNRDIENGTKEMEDTGTQEFGTIRRTTNWGVDIPGGTMGPNGTRSFLRGWYGLDAGSGGSTGYSNGPMQEVHSVSSSTNRHVPLSTSEDAEQGTPINERKARESTDTWDGNYNGNYQSSS